MSTVPALLLQALDRAPDAPWLWVRDRDAPLRSGHPDPDAPGWRRLSIRDAALLVSGLARRLEALGVADGTPVAVVGAPPAVGLAAELAIWALGGISVALCPETPPRQLALQVEHAAAEVILLEDAVAHDRFQEALEDTESLRHLRTFWNSGGCPPLTPGEADLGWLRARIEGREGQSPATVCFVSGAKPDAPALCLTHETLRRSLDRTPAPLSRQPKDRCLLAAPLSALAARMRAHKTLQTLQGLFVCPPSDAPAVLRHLQPEALLAPPALIQRLQGPRASPPPPVASWARRVGAAVAHLQRHGRPLSPTLALQHRLARLLWLDAQRATWGGRLRVIGALAAPTQPGLQAWFASLGVTVLGSWALPEAGGTLTADTEEHHRPGTVGLPASSVQLRIAEDGEVLLRTPDPGDAWLLHPGGGRTAPVGTRGWLATATLGAIDPDGFLRLLGPKAVTTAGANPQPRDRLS